MFTQEHFAKRTLRLVLVIESEGKFAVFVIVLENYATYLVVCFGLFCERHGLQIFSILDT